MWWWEGEGRTDPCWGRGPKCEKEECLALRVKRHFVGLGSFCALSGKQNMAKADVLTVVQIPNLTFTYVGARVL